jgi:hypothetical protein
MTSTVWQLKKNSVELPGETLRGREEQTWRHSRGTEWAPRLCYASTWADEDPIIQ